MNIAPVHPPGPTPSGGKSPAVRTPIFSTASFRAIMLERLLPNVNFLANEAIEMEADQSVPLDPYHVNSESKLWRPNKLVLYPHQIVCMCLCQRKWLVVCISDREERM